MGPKLIVETKDSGICLPRIRISERTGGPVNIKQSCTRIMISVANNLWLSLTCWSNCNLWLVEWSWRCLIKFQLDKKWRHPPSHPMFARSFDAWRASVTNNEVFRWNSGCIIWAPATHFIPLPHHLVRSDRIEDRVFPAAFRRAPRWLTLVTSPIFVKEMYLSMSINTGRGCGFNKYQWWWQAERNFVCQFIYNDFSFPFHCRSSPKDHFPHIPGCDAMTEDYHHWCKNNKSQPWEDAYGIENDEH